MTKDEYNFLKMKLVKHALGLTLISIFLAFGIFDAIPMYLMGAPLWLYILHSACLIALVIYYVIEIKEILDIKKDIKRNEKCND